MIVRVHLWKVSSMVFAAASRLVIRKLRIWPAAGVSDFSEGAGPAVPFQRALSIEVSEDKSGLLASPVPSPEGADELPVCWGKRQVA